MTEQSTPRGGGVITWPNPLHWMSTDYLEHQIWIDIYWLDAPLLPHTITGMTVHRDPECEFTRIVVGLGTGNSPNTTDKVFEIPEGTTTVVDSVLRYLANKGMVTVEDFISSNVTALGPAATDGRKASGS